MQWSQEKVFAFMLMMLLLGLNWIKSSRGLHLWFFLITIERLYFKTSDVEKKKEMYLNQDKGKFCLADIFQTSCQKHWIAGRLLTCLYVFPQATIMNILCNLQRMVKV